MHTHAEVSSAARTGRVASRYNAAARDERSVQWRDVGRRAK